MIRHVFDIESHGATHTGRIRDLNEDRYLVKSDSGVFVVADGMGGHDAGEIASTSIVEHLNSIGIPASALDLRARFEDSVIMANRQIREISSVRNGGTIGSTLAALLAFEHQYACLWAGDSRIYMLRDGQFSQVSRDHTEVQDLLDRGLLTPEEAINWPRRNVITRAIGAEDDPLLDFAYGKIHANDKFLLCSDGLTAHVSDQEMREILHRHSAHKACDALIQLTLERGATDNVTVVVVQFRSLADAKSTRTDRLGATRSEPS